MRKLFIILIGVGVLIATPILSQEQEAESAFKSYPLISVNYEIFYFIKPKKSQEGHTIKAKMPLTRYLSVELGYGLFVKPVLSYSIGTNSYTGIGKERFTDINFNILYHFWFLKELQIKAGINYYKFDSGWIQVNPSESTSGYMIEMYENWKDNLWGINAGANLDVSVYKEFYVSTKLSYRYILLTDNITKNGIINFSIGLGYKL